MASLNPLEWSARLVVDLVQALANRRIVVSCIALALTLVAAFADVAVDGLGVNPARTTCVQRICHFAGRQSAGTDHVRGRRLVPRGLSSLASGEGKSHVSDF